jgi:hypothetical protein
MKTLTGDARNIAEDDAAFLSAWKAEKKLK